MQNLTSRIIRKEQTEIEFSRLKFEVGSWCEKRKTADPNRQYETQLQAVKSVLDSASNYLLKKLHEINPAKPVGEVYDECRLFDERIIWLRKLWQFYRDKFDQRDDENLQKVLSAADEIVWSCHQEFYLQAEQNQLTDISYIPAPLPYLETVSMPAARQAEEVPFELRSAEAGFLQTLISKLPVPLIYLPQSCVKSPWWLVYIGHEVGHHVQYALGKNKRFVSDFRDQIKAAILENKGDDTEADKWGRWGEEIFADIFSLYTMGQWALWAIVEAEMKNNEAMHKPPKSSKYPSPFVRFRLMAKYAESMGLDAANAVGGLNLETVAAENVQTKRDFCFAEKLVEKLCGNLPGKKVSLKDLTGFWAEDYSVTGDVWAWARDLCDQTSQFSVKKNLRNPRLLASATVAAWSIALNLDEEERKLLRAHLEKKSVEVIVAAREGGTRSSAKTIDTENLGKELAEELLQATVRDAVSEINL